jgi:TonB family protein
MGMTKIQIGVAAALVVAGGSTLWSERQTESKLRAENSALAEQTAQISDLKTENNRLEAAAQRAEILRNQEVELGRLRFEAERLQQEIGKTVMARSAQLAGNRPTKPSQPRPPQLTVDGQPIYPLSQLDERPSPTVQVEAAYPADLKVAGVEGKVLVSLVINPDGLVRELKVEQATNEVFAEAAKQALEKWKFKPAIKDGVPVNSQGAADWF